VTEIGELSFCPTEEASELYIIMVGDRPVGGTLGILYHYSIEYWRADVASVTLNREWDRPDFEEEYPGSTFLKGVELLREGGWSVYEYKKRWVRDDGWDEVNVAISVIHRPPMSTNVMPIFQGDKATVSQRWSSIAHAVTHYEYAEQSGFNGTFCMWPNSVYYVGDDVNNSNTFVRVMADAAELTMREMKGFHPGRMVPEPITTRYSPLPWRARVTPPPEPD